MSVTELFRTLVHTLGRTLRHPLRRSALSFLLALTLLAQPLALYAGTIEVDDTTCTLADAVVVANSDTSSATCTLVDGVLGGPDTLNLTAPDFTYSIAAPPAGTTAIPDITSNITINGNHRAIERSGPQAYRLFYVASTGDLTINSVNIHNFAPGEDGGAIYSNGAVTITDSNIFSNTAGDNGDGGAILNDDGATLIIRDSFLHSNTAKLGGAIANYHTSIATLDNVLIYDNAATDGGGVIDNALGSTIVITKSYFLNNQAAADGGAILNGGEDSEVETAVIIHSSKFERNHAGNGGAIFNHAAAILTLRDSEVVSNTATLGGGLYNTDATATISNTRVANNLAIGAGGGIYNWTNGNLTVTGGMIVENNAEDGAGLGNYIDSTASLENVPFLFNSSSKDGGAVDNYDGSTLAITATAFLNNSALEDGGAINNITSTITLHNSQISSSNATTGTVNNVAGTVTASSVSIYQNSASYGGAFRNSAGAELIIINTEIYNNGALVGGAVINELGSALTITNATISANVASVAGAIFNTSGSKATLDGVDFKGNVALVAGAVGNNLQSSMVISDSNFITNAATFSGGGISNGNQATLVVDNTIFSENSAMVGAAIVNTDTSTVTVTASSFLSNTAGVGGALYNGKASKATLSGVKLIANQGLSDTLTGGIFASELLNVPAAASPNLTAQSTSAVSITNSCIIQNVVVAISAPESGFNSGGAVDATNNWWGSAYGPSGDGPGPGDFIEGNVTFAPFLTAPILNCPITAPFLATQIPFLEKAK